MDLFYSILAMLAPAMMLLVGVLWRVSPPPFQGSGLSYNTELTRSDPEAWELAHRHCSRLWIRIGLMSGGASAILLSLFKTSISKFWMWLIVGQMLLFCISVFMVDLFLKSKFGEKH